MYIQTRKNRQFPYLFTPTNDTILKTNSHGMRLLRMKILPKVKENVRACGNIYWE